MERRTFLVQGQPDRITAIRSSRHHHRRVFVVILGLAALAIFLAILYVVTPIVTALSEEEFTDTAWLTSPRDGVQFQNALHQLSLQKTPPVHALPLNQILFVSCNRHDRSQAYWANIAVAVQCEVLSRSDRAAAAPCRRLYAGKTPLSLTAGISTKEAVWVREAAPLGSSMEVPLGACGSVYDSTAAAQHRASYMASVKAGAAKKSRAALRFPVAPLKSDPVPLDAVLWLGDAIYADKRADGKDRQSLLHHFANTLAEVGGFWRIQRDAPEYNAFVSSCVATSAPPSLHDAPLTKPSVPVLEEGDHDEAEPQRMLTAIAAAQIEMLGGVGNDADTLVIPQPPATAATPQRNVWGTWDDHDMGKNDGGREYPHRNVTQRFFLDFLKAPATDPRWTRDGVYEAYTVPFHAVVDRSKGWGPPLQKLLHQLYEHAMCVILLDVRSFRDAPNASHAGDILGAAQWQWFEEQLQRFTTRTADGQEPCAVTFIGSGIQFMLDEKPAENWAAFPDARDRLLGLLRVYKAERVAFLTGDVHMGELGGDFTARTIAHVVGYPLLEATSSGLTHSANMFLLPSILPKLFHTPRRLSVYFEKNFGVARISLDLLHLPALRPYLNDTTAPSGPSSVLFQSGEERQSVRNLVQQALNITFTIFSLQQHGRPVYRLNFPLSMLTYAHGPTYLDATVDPFHGDVQMRSAVDGAVNLEAMKASAPASSIFTFQLQNGTVVSVAHYPTVTPVPLVTWYSRLAQQYIFTRSSVSESLKWCLITQAGIVVVLIVLLMLWILRWVRRQRRQRAQRRSHPTSPLLFRNAELHGDSTLLGHSSPSLSLAARGRQRWWHKLLHGLRKDKEG